MKSEMKLAALTTSVSIGAICVLGYVVNDSIKTVNELRIEIESKDNQIIDINGKYTSILDEKSQIELKLSETTEELESARQKIKEYNKIVYFNEHNVSQSSGTTISHMKRALKDTGLYNDAQSFVDAEKEYGVNAFFIAAIAAQESAWGTSDRAMYQNNLTGHAVYNSAAKGTYFSSRHKSIMSTAEMLRDNYLTPGAIHYNGLSSVDVNKKYCFLEDKKTIDYTWSSKINSIASDLVYKANDFKKI